jgi:hypothetical protein
MPKTTKNNRPSISVILAERWKFGFVNTSLIGLIPIQRKICLFKIARRMKTKPMSDKKIIISWLFGIILLLNRLTFLDTYRRLTVWTQQQRRDWRDSFSISCHFWKIAPVSERRSCYPLEALLGKLHDYTASANSANSVSSM